MSESKILEKLDAFMTEDDYEALLAYRKEKKEGKLISHKQLKKQIFGK